MRINTTRARTRIGWIVAAAVSMLSLASLPASADDVPQSLPFTQDWTNAALITTSDVWSGVPGIEGYRGDGLASTSAVDPQTILGEGTPVLDVNANTASPTFTTGGVTEFDQLPDPTIALAGSGTARAPYILVRLNTTGFSAINVSYLVRDIEATADNAVQPVALQYRVGSSGSFINVPTAYIPDATTGPNLAVATTPISVTLPSTTDNQSVVQFRVMTTDAVGSDEWVGIDNISVTGTPIGGGDVAPTVTGTTPTAGQTAVPLGSDITVNFSEPVTNTNAFSVTCTASGPHAVTVTGGPSSFTINPNVDFAANEQCTLSVSATGIADQDAIDPPDNMAANFNLTFTTVAADPCTSAITQIPAIQGAGPSVAITSAVTTRGVVVGDYEGATGLNGFYIQAQTGDADPATSDAIFVFNPGNDSVTVGDLVSVTGTPAEFQGQSQIGFVTSIAKCGTGVVTPLDIALPMTSPTAFESYEGMLVRFAQPLYVTEHFQLGRFGQVVVSGTDRLRQPTAAVAPGAAAAALQAANDLNKLIIDDTLQTQNPDPIIFGRNLSPLSATNTLRGGDSTTGAVGVLTYTWAGNAASGNAFRLRPQAAAPLSINFAAVNARPSEAPNVGGSVRAVGLNLLNYFNTFTLCANGLGDAAPATNKCRGAESAAEFTRQSDKTIGALVKLNADIIGVNEIENDGYGPTSAMQDLVNKLNAATAPGTYAFIDADARTGLTDALGTDGIKVGLIYKPGTVTPIGTTRVLDSAGFVNGGDGSPRNRVSLAQAFEEIATGGRVVVNVNHLKSKGSACDLPDQLDGQANCAVVRTNAANALTAWLATDPTGVGDPDTLLLGDYNSYTKEAPIAAITSAGFTNLVESFGGANAYSYVFDGQWGYLDYAFSSPTLTPQITGVAEYHINSDEPNVLDFNTNFKSAGQITSLYAPNEFRVSDHDPVIVGLNLTKPGSTTTLTAAPATVVAGQPFTVTASVAPVSGAAVPTGSVAFSDGTPLSTVTLDAAGKAVLNQTRPAGVYNYSGAYAGSPTLGASTGSISVTVTKAPATAAVSAPATAQVGAATLLNATVSSQYLTPTGTVTFYDGATPISGAIPLTAGAVANSATASFSWTAGPAGSRSITVQYSGDANVLNAVSPAAPVTVTQPVQVKPRVKILQVCTTTTTAQYSVFTWSVKNRTSGPVTFVWRVKGATPAQTGTITLAPGATSATFTTNRWARNTTLEVLVNGKVIESRDAKKTRAACLDSESDDDDEDEDDDD